MKGAGPLSPAPVRSRHCPSL